MVWLTRIFVFIFFIAVIVLALAFMAANEDRVTANFFLAQGTATLGIWLVAAFVMGLIVTMLASFPVIMAYKFRLRRAQKKQLNSSPANLDDTASV